MNMQNVEERSEHFRGPRGIAALWFGVLAGPVVWVVGFGVDYALVRVACVYANTLPLHLVTLAMLLATVLAGWVALREWRRAGEELPGEGYGAEPRSRFLAALGILTSAFFVLLIVAQWVPKLFLNPCMGV